MEGTIRKYINTILFLLGIFPMSFKVVTICLGNIAEDISIPLFGFIKVCFLGNNTDDSTLLIVYEAIKANFGMAGWCFLFAILFMILGILFTLILPEVQVKPATLICVAGQMLFIFAGYGMIFSYRDKVITALDNELSSFGLLGDLFSSYIGDFDIKISLLPLFLFIVIGAANLIIALLPAGQVSQLPTPNAIKSRIPKPSVSKPTAYYGAMVGRKSSKAYAFPFEKGKKYYFCRQDNKIYVCANPKAELLAYAGYDEEKGQYQLVSKMKGLVFLEEKQKELDIDTVYYLERGTAIYLYDQKNRIELA